MLPPASTAVIDVVGRPAPTAPKPSDRRSAGRSSRSSRSRRATDCSRRARHPAPCRTASGCAAARAARTSARGRATSPRPGSTTSLPGASTPAPYCSRAAANSAQRDRSRTARARAPRSASRRRSSSDRLDDLHPGRRDHAAEQDVREHHARRRSAPPTRSERPNISRIRLPAPTICGSGRRDDRQRAGRLRCDRALAEPYATTSRTCTCRGCAAARQ